MALQPNYPMVNLGNLYIQGLRLVYGTTTTFSVNAGQCRESQNINDIVLDPIVSTSPTAVNINIALVGNGLNLLDTGVIAASTLYYIYAVGSSVYGADNGQDANASLGIGPLAGTAITPAATYPDNYLPAGIIYSLSPSLPALPVGYDMYRRIGAFRVNSAVHIEPFWQTGFGQNRTMWYQTAVVPGTVGAAAVTYATIGALLNIVPQFPTEVLVDVSMAANTAGNAVYLAGYGNTAAGDNTRMSSPVVTTPYLFQLRAPAEFNIAATPVVEIDYKLTSAFDVATFLIAGYIDAL